MPDCEIDILDAAVISPTDPGDADLVLMILPDGTAIWRTWGQLKTALVPNDYERVVDDGVDPDEINTGTGNIILDQFAGFRVRVIRNGVTQAQIVNATGFYYDYDKPTGTFDFHPAAEKDELFQITAY